MNLQPPSARHRKGRLLIVGRLNGSDDLDGQLTHPALRASNLYEAIGEITSAAATAPIATVLITSSSLPLNGHEALDALKKTDPSLRLILCAQSQTPAELIKRAATSCDRVMQEPLDVNQLQEFIDDDFEDVVIRVTTQEPVISFSTPVSTPTPTPSPIPPIPSPVPTERPAKTKTNSPLIETAHVEPAETLGDTDLVIAAMSNPHGLRETALRLLKQSTGWNILKLTDEADENDPSPKAPVTAGGITFGVLQSPQANNQTVSHWADWLGAWLLLDRRYRDYRRMAYQDDLTAAWNRRYFESFLAETINKAAMIRRPVTVMVFDIDDFKQYNDRYGHEAGDIILIETVRLLKSEIRPCDRVCRIGGDEFAVIFADLDGPREVGSSHPETVETIARRFQKQICEMKFPKLGIDAPGTLSISGGIAAFPWDGSSPAALLRHADQLSFYSKRKGKNALTFGPGAQKVCPPPPSSEDLPRDPQMD